MPSSRYIFGTLPWYSVLIVAGICAAIFLASREEKRLGLPQDTVIDLALSLVPLGIVGARLYYVVFAWDSFRADPISVLYVWQGGLAIYGGIIGGLLAAVLFARRRKLPMLTLFDMIVPGLALAQAVGRWGNFFNMEAYGAPITQAAWQFFPAAVLIPEGGGLVWHQATFFYESMWDLGTACTLWALRTRTKKRGDLFLWYLLLYGAGRLVIEGLRMDSLYTVGGTGRVSQLVSAAACVAAAAVFASRTLRRIDRKQLLTGGGAAAVMLAVCIALPAPAPAFPLSGAVWAGVAAGCCGLGAALIIRRKRMAVPIAAAIAGQVIRVIAAQQGAAGLGVSTLCCALISLCAILCGACVYEQK